MTKPISQDFDERLYTELTKHLNRAPTQNEIVNADKDSDLVNEVLWQLVESLGQRITNLEAKQVL